MKFSQDFFVGVMDVDDNKKLTNFAVLEMMSDISMIHSEQTGQTTTEGQSPVSWVLLGWRVKVYQRPRLFSTVHVSTWIQKAGHVRANRDYLVCDENGEKVAEATAEWTPLETATGKFLRITPELIDPYEPEPECVNFPDYKLPALRRFAMEPEKVRQLDVNTSMFDYNKHLHNSVYMVLAEQILSEDLVLNGIDEFEMLYKLEITCLDPVRLEYAVVDGVHTVAVRDTDDTLHAVVRAFA